MNKRKLLLLGTLFLFVIMSCNGPQRDVYRETPSPIKEAEEIYSKGDYATAFRLFSRLAAQGDARACDYLGYMYEKGQGVARDYVEAVRCYRAGAERESAYCQNNLASMYRYGRGVKQDYAEAVRWYLKSAEKWFSDAQYNLGYMYEIGQGVTQDYSEAVRWYEKAVLVGNAYAQNNLGSMYKNGRGVKQDYTEAALWYQRAAVKGHSTAQYNLGVMYYEGRGVTQDPVEAFRWFQKAAEQGNSNAQDMSGYMYLKGKGAKQNYAEALRWFKRAAEQENASAQYNMGVMYYYGWGISQNYAEAGRWFLKAAQQGYGAAEANLGNLHWKGEGVKKDYAEAVRWFRKAAEHGSAHGYNALGWSYQFGEGAKQDNTEAVRCYQKAVEGGSDLAAINLGQLYEFGKGFPQGFDEAMRWYRKGVEMGNKDSQHALDRMSRGIRGIRGLQQLMLREGYYTGPLNGIWGQETENSIQRYYSKIQDIKSENDDSFGVQDLAYILNYLDRPWKVAEYRTPSKTLTAQATIPLQRKVDFGSYYALVIGIRNYRHINQLKTSDHDAREVANLLSKKYSFKVTLLPDASRGDILAALERFRGELKPTDNLLIYYAGHGEMDKTTDRGYWLPVDAAPKNRADWIGNEDITNDIKAMQARHILVVADSCYSGSLFRSLGASFANEGGEEELLQKMAQKKSRKVLTSGGLEPVLDTGVSGHSVFANAFLSTLRENDRIVIMDTLFETIRRRVAANADQTPVYESIPRTGHDDGDFVFVPATSK